MPETGWLNRQFRDIKRESRTWPEWMGRPTNERRTTLSELMEKPRGDCLRWLAERKATDAACLPRRLFDTFVRSGAFSQGPLTGTFGQGYGEPCCPDRQAWGQLKDGRYVFCNLNEDRS